VRSPLQALGNPLRLETLTTTLCKSARNCLCVRPFWSLPRSSASHRWVRGWRSQPRTRLPSEGRCARLTSRASRQRWAVAVPNPERQTRPIERRHLPACRDWPRHAGHAAERWSSLSFHRQEHRAEIQMCSRSKLSSRRLPLDARWVGGGTGLGLTEPVV